MTESDLAKIKFRMVSHFNFGTEHACSYESTEYRPKITICVHTPVKEDYSFGRAITHYQFNGKVYKSKKKVLEAVTIFEQGQNR